MSGITTSPSYGFQKDLTLNKTFDKIYITGQKVGSERVALDTINMSAYRVSAVNTAAAGSTKQIIVLTSHNAKVGDIISFLSGSQNEFEVHVEQVVDANTIKLAKACSADLTGSTFDILRPKTNRVDSSGAVIATISSSPVQFTKNGSTVAVTEDTVTPSNNIPLPVKLTGVTGDITITAQNLNIQSTHTGANPDSLQIGDGTDLLAINASGEALVTASQSGTWNVTNISGTISLPTGAATEATLSTLNGKIPSNLTVTATRLLVDGSGVTQPVSGAFYQATQPVSAASLPLPTGAATEATLSSLNTKMPAQGQALMAASVPVVIASNQSAINTSAAQSGTWNITNISGTISLPTGAATETTLAAMSAKLPASLGIKTAANSLSVAPASDALFKLSAQTASYASITNLTNSAQTFTAPAGAFGFLIWADPVNDTSGYVRFACGSTATSSVGMPLEPGRAETIDGGTDISVFATAGSSQKVYVHWFVRS